MSNKSIHALINMIAEENLVQAQTLLKEQLNEKLTQTLSEKFESYAPTLFEKWDMEKADKNKDGEVSDWEKASTEWANKEGDDEETESKKQHEEEEEDDSEDQEDEETDEESEEDEETDEEEDE